MPLAWSGPAPPKATNVKSRASSPTVDGDDADRIRHVLVRHLNDGLRRLLDSHAERRAKLRQFLMRLVSVQPHFSREEVVRVEPAQHQVRVGDRYVIAALVVANGSGVCSGALRADAQEASFVDPGDAAAAGADRRKIDERRRDRESPLDLVVRVVRNLPLPHDSDIATRAAHVERHKVLVMRQFPEKSAPR